MGQFFSKTCTDVLEKSNSLAPAGNRTYSSDVQIVVYSPYPLSRVHVWKGKHGDDNKQCGETEAHNIYTLFLEFRVNFRQKPLYDVGKPTQPVVH
jgi:hypothetical protein